MNEWQKQETKRNISSGFIIVIITIAICLVLGGIGLGFKYIFGVGEANVDREIYKNNASYVDGQIKDLSDYKQEYERAIKSGDEEGANAVIGYIKDDFSNFPITKIENKLLKQFLEDVINGKYD